MVLLPLALLASGLLHPFSLVTADTFLHTPLQFNIISPQNHATFNTSQVPVVYSVNSDVRYSYYVLDGPSKSTHNWHRFEGNMTLTQLCEGAHNITLLVRVTDNNLSPSYAKETVFFKVDLNNTPSTSTSAPSPTIPEYSSLIMPLLIIATVFWVAVLRKRNLPAEH